MADPTFNGAALTTAAGRNRIGSREVRVYTETLPGVNGLFAQTHGYGGREIEVTGLLTGSAAAAALAVAAVMDAFRQRERLADGATVAAFTGTDGWAYANCLLTAYEHGRVRIAHNAPGSYTAYLPIRARLKQLTP